MQSTRSSFSSAGVSINLDAFFPSTPPPHPAVIALYGSGGNHDGLVEPATLLAEHGFATFALHYFNRTDHSFITGKPTIVANFPLWGKTVWDAISHIEKLPEVDPRRIGLLGFSLGAYLALSVAAVDSRVQAVVDYYGGFPKEMKLFMRRLCPVLILHGEADSTVPVTEAYDLQKILEKKSLPYELQIYPNEGHGFNDAHWQDSLQRTLAFFQKPLVPQGG